MSVKQAVRDRDNWVQFFKFGVVGGSGFLVNMLVTVIMNKLHGGTKHSDDPLFHVLGWNFSYSALIWIVAFVIANFVNFQLNRSWTFRDVHHRSWWREFWPFFGIGAAAAFVGMFIKVALKSPHSPIYLPASIFDEGAGLTSREYWAQLITIVVTMPINFIFNKLFTFVAVQGHHHGEEEHVEIPLVASVVAPELVDDTGEIRKLSDEEIARRDRERERAVSLGDAKPRTAAPTASTAGTATGATRADETGRRLEG